ncbi:hypothetical protein EVAR_50712_1 [Eumeta japonica]|uniref:Uncharacterized protein n=1 Tax=Eumeta variegata TaxID=151549 RepID=A0A4C1YM00_EUMVA|nr:hypothetical protein EVAR_50712_1 [Eumeta japonica]
MEGQNQKNRIIPVKPHLIHIAVARQTNVPLAKDRNTFSTRAQRDTARPSPLAAITIKYAAATSGVNFDVVVSSPEIPQMLGDRFDNTPRKARDP